MCENDYGNVKMGVLNIYELRNYSPLVQINIEIKHVTVTFSDLKVEINVITIHWLLKICGAYF